MAFPAGAAYSRTFVNGAEFSYEPQSAAEATFEIVVPPGSFLEFAADSSVSAGCNSTSVITVSSDACALAYAFNQCSPF